MKYKTAKTVAKCFAQIFKIKGDMPAGNPFFFFFFTKIITFHENAKSISEMSNLLSLAYRKTPSPTQELSNDWNKIQSCIHGTCLKSSRADDKVNNSNNE